MLNNQQFYDAQGAGDQMVCTESWKDNTKCKLPLVAIEDEPNTIDVEAALEQVKKNDSTLTDLNLNNVYNIQISTILEFCEALKERAPKIISKNILKVSSSKFDNNQIFVRNRNFGKNGNFRKKWKFGQKSKCLGKSKFGQKISKF